MNIALRPFPMRFLRHILLGVFVFIVISGIPETSGFAAIRYQDFEPSNGTPSKPSAETNTPEYGWAFGEASAVLSQEGHPVHSGQYSWRVAIPDAETLHSGTGIASMTQTYNVNFIPSCYDRLTFWIWPEPMHPGAHTVMVKFFDHGVYHEEGIGVWTLEAAQPEEWTKLTILFSQLPKDFDLSRVDKIEFFNYWNGVYYYDDILITSVNGEDEDSACLETEGYIVCQYDPLSKGDGENPCVSVYADPTDLVLDYMLMQGNRTIKTFHDLRDMDDAVGK